MPESHKIQMKSVCAIRVQTNLPCERCVYFEQCSKTGRSEKRNCINRSKGKKGKKKNGTEEKE